MTLPDDTDPEEPTTPIEEPKKSASPTGNVPDQSKNWESSYKGLQRAYDKLKEKYDKQVEAYDQLSAEHEELKQEKTKTDREVAKLTDDHSKVAQEKTTLEGQIAGFSTYQERVKLIMTEFPDLSPFEGKGLLPPAATVEEMRTKFTDFREAIKSTVSEDVKKTVQGAAPGGGPSNGNPPDGSGMTYEQLYNRLSQLAGQRDQKSRDEYASLQNVWDNLPENKPS